MGDVAECGFAGGTEEYGVGGCGELVEVSEECEVVLVCFAKAEAGIDDDVGLGYAEGLGGLGAVHEVVEDFVCDIPVGWVLLHVLGGALFVHEDDGGVGIGGESECIVVGVFAGGDVVDDGGACVECGPGDGEARGVDADGGLVFLGEFGDEGDGAFDLLVG